jgi:hypothetical protein
MSAKRRLQQLQVVLDLKVRQEQALAKQLALAYQAWQHQSATLQQLTGYQQEYMASAGQHTQPWSRGNLQAFLTQLEQVLLTQGLQVDQSAALHRHAQQLWQVAHQQSQRFAEYLAEQKKLFAQQQANQQDIAAQELFGLYQRQIAPKT